MPSSSWKDRIKVEGDNCVSMFQWFHSIITLHRIEIGLPGRYQVLVIMKNIVRVHGISRMNRVGTKRNLKNVGIYFSKVT